MKKVQKTYTAKFKREAVRLAQTSGKPIAQVARSLGISDTSLHQWRKELAARGDEAFPGSGHQSAKARGTALSQTRIGSDSTGARHLKKPSLYSRKHKRRYAFVAENCQEYPVNMSKKGDCHDNAMIESFCELA